MNRAPVHKKFIFNEKFDQNWLYELYQNDYTCIAEVFCSSLDSFREDLPTLTGAFESADIAALKKATHKLKPVFGFTGLLQYQEMMERFEHACLSASNITNLTMQYIELMDWIKEGKNILQEEYNRLTAFTS